MRYQVLDIFRGLTIILMIFVNSSAPGYAPFSQLEHAEWFGFTFADFVFPAFLFAMGASFAFSSRATKDEIFWRAILKRTAILFALGLFLNWFPFFIYNSNNQFEWKYFENLRFMGVLQRIALCYLLAAIFVRFLTLRGILITCFAILLVYWLLLLGFAPTNMAFDKAKNFGSVIDNFIIPHNHIFRRDDGFEPEGILGTLPATANVLFGYLSAKFIINNDNIIKKTKLLLAYGLIFIIAAISFSFFMPISKKLWTSSFVLVNIGCDLILLSFLIFATEYKNWNFGQNIAISFGKNPLIIYLISVIIYKLLLAIRATPTQSIAQFISQNLIAKIVNGPWVSLIFAFLITSICYFIAYKLERKNIIIKI